MQGGISSQHPACVIMGFYITEKRILISENFIYNL
jgi:hypothetical protein